jgi:hypothetical protein
MLERQVTSILLTLTALTGFGLGVAVPNFIVQDKAQKEPGRVIDERIGKAVNLKDVPTSVQETARPYFTSLEDATIQVSDRERTPHYKIVGKGPDGNKVQLKIVADGRMQQVVRDVGIDGLPSSARAHLQKEYPNAKTDSVEAVETHTYIVRLTHDGKTEKFSVTPGGRVRPLDSDEEDEDKH